MYVLIDDGRQFDATAGIVQIDVAPSLDDAVVITGSLHDVHLVEPDTDEVIDIAEATFRMMNVPDA